jgi:prepilin-type N-terminal cleavage/methylation domain-containing protein
MTYRRAFTVIEIIVAIIILALMSAAIIPALMGRIRDAQSSALAQTLFSLSQAVFEYRKAVTVNPSQLTLLAGKPTGADLDACGAPIGATNANNWRGPYISRELLSTGVGIGDARIENTLRRVPGPPTILFIDVEFVDSLAAVDIDLQYDGGAGTPTTGTVRWTKAVVPPLLAAPAGMVNLSYGIPINGC